MSTPICTRRVAGVVAIASALAMGGAAYASPAAAQSAKMGTIDSALSAAS